MAYLKVLSQNLSAETNGNNENPQSGQMITGPRFKLDTSQIKFEITAMARVTTRPAFRGTVPKTYVKSRVPHFA
jgi:hypothetical protein